MQAKTQDNNQKGRSREDSYLEALKVLSYNGKASFDTIAKVLHTTKTTAYNQFKDLVDEYGLKFVPEINIDGIWKYEFIKFTRPHKKREIVEEALESLPDAIGFEEYMILIKFLNGKPKNEEILNAISNSYEAQFVATLDGEYDLVMYVVARNYMEADRFLLSFDEKMSKYNIVSEMDRIMPAFGFFPLSKKLIERFNIPESYLDLLLGLSDNGREELKAIAAKFKREPDRIMYAMERLRDTGILKHVTYYEEKPKYNVRALIKLTTNNVSAFLKNRNKWFLDMVKDQGRHNEYIFVADISNPTGILMFMNFETKKDLSSFVKRLSDNLKVIKTTTIGIKDVLVGHLGVRNFDMRYSMQYEILANQNLVPKMKKEPKEIEEEYKEEKDLLD